MASIISVCEHQTLGLSMHKLKISGTYIEGALVFI